MPEKITVCFQEAANGNREAQEYLRRAVFIACIKRFFAQDGIIDGGNQLFVFRGFPKDFYFALERLYGEIQHFSGEWNGEYPDANNQNVNLLLKYFFNASGIRWCFYEEFEAVRRVLQGDFSIYEGRIVTVANDILIENTNAQEIRFFENIKRAVPVFDENVISEAKRITLDELDEITMNLLNGKLNYQNFCIDAEPENIRNLLSLNSLGYYYHVNFFAQKAQIADDKNEYLPLLQKYWGKDAQFRKQKYYSDPLHSNETTEISQGCIISEIIAQSLAASSGESYSDVIVTAPTGAGKSIFFQIPGIYFHGNNEVTIVVTPLVDFMSEQVTELREHGINFATFINSAITFDERNQRISNIQSGVYSIVYLSPELLITSVEISNIIGERRIALFVIDEAHLVTTWGSEFRADYIFLRDFIKRLRRNQRFPILCLTETAVYDGVNDTILEIQNVLNLQHSIIHFGYVRRENIQFEIRNADENADKRQLTEQAILNYAQNRTKAIIYFQYDKQVEDMYVSITQAHPEIVVYRYYDALNSMEKEIAKNNFKNSQIAIMLATKALGTNINIDNIKGVYHYAPSGTLADYIQEIGRAARTLENVLAVTDYRQADMNYTSLSWNSSIVKSHQLHEIAKKLFSMYQSKGEEFSVSPESFEYIFTDENDSDKIGDKVKQALLLLRDDTNAIRVSPSRYMRQYSYVEVSPQIENGFINRYSRPYCMRMRDVEPSHIFRVNTTKLYAERFQTMNFGDFSKQFRDGTLFPFANNTVNKVMRIAITYNGLYTDIRQTFLSLAAVIQDSFREIVNRFGDQPFHFSDFKEIFRRRYNAPISDERIRMMFDIFCCDDGGFLGIMPQWKFIKGSSETDIYNREPMRMFQNVIADFLIHRIDDARPYQHGARMRVVYKPCIQAKPYQFLASLLQIFGLASYEITGGENNQLSIEITEPDLLRQIAEASLYRSTTLHETWIKHESAVRVMEQFFGGDFENNSDRWKFIENYFLGRDVLN